jgi:GR25 family glycosyltransferase involved in LPS biosynthesis
MLSFKPNVITLKTRQDRIEKIQNFYKNYNNEINFFFGLSKDVVKKNKSKITTKFCNNLCTIPMVGCASSHILLWKWISESEDGYYMVIEDDTFINLDVIEKKFNDIKDLFKKYNNLILQIVGEGLNLKYTETFNSLTLEKYKYHFFFGCYILTPNTAKIFYLYFLKNKINYHIDLSLNYIKNINILLLRDDNIGIQEGKTDSNMKNSNKIFYDDNYKCLYYSLNFPICSICNVIITFNVILLFLLIILTCFYKNIFMFCIIGILILDFIKIDY